MSTLDLSPETTQPRPWDPREVPEATYGSRFHLPSNMYGATGRPTRITVATWSRLNAERAKTETIGTPTQEIEVRRLVGERADSNGTPNSIQYRAKLVKTLQLPIERRSTKPTKFFGGNPSLRGGRLLDSFFLGELAYEKATDNVVWAALEQWATSESQPESDDLQQASATVAVALAARAGCTLNYEESF